MTNMETVTIPNQPIGDVQLADMAQSFWQRLFGNVLRPAAVKISVGYILLLVLIAVFIPFIANSRPYTIVINAHGREPATRVFPLFSALTRLDLILLISAAGAMLYVVGHLHSRREKDLMQRRTIRWRWLGLAFLLALTGSVLVAIFRHNVLDVTNYQRLVQNGRAMGAIYAPIHWGYADMEPLSRDMINQLPSARHWMGTDGDGRDVLARLLWSTRIAMGVGFVSQIIALLIGVVFGCIDGYFSGLVDLIGMRLVETVEAVPTFFLILTFVAVYGRDIFSIMVILGVTGWTGYARFVRAEVLRLRTQDFVIAAEASGLPLWRVLFRHILPNGVTPVIVSAAFGFASAVTFESTLSFLGVGVRPPTASWGEMLNAAGNPATVFRWWEAMGPGMALFAAVLAFYTIGQSLRDALDPRMSGKG